MIVPSNIILALTTIPRSSASDQRSPAPSSGGPYLSVKGLFGKIAVLVTRKTVAEFAAGEPVATLRRRRPPHLSKTSQPPHPSNATPVGRGRVSASSHAQLLRGQTKS